MKKIICFVLLVALTLTLFGCAASKEEDAPKVLKAGFSMQDVTPDYPAGLGGYSDAETRKHTGVLDPVYVTCVAASYGEDTVLMFTIDNCAASGSFVKNIQDMVNKSTGIKKENIFVSATHTHSAPSINSGNEAGRYKSELMGAMVVAAEESLKDLAPATAYSGSTMAKGLNFDRHYYMSDGKYQDYTSDITYASHAGTTDEQMILLKFDREEKQDILLVNWQSHPDHSYANGFNNISADYPGALRNHVANETEMLCAFFAGASGNQVPNSKIKSEKTGLSMQKYGQKLAQIAIDYLPELKKVEVDGIKVGQITVQAEVDHSLDHMLSAADEIYNVWKTKGKDVGDKLGKEKYDFSSVYQARAIRQRKNMPASYDMTLYAWSIGGVGFVSGDYEMFSDAGMYIRKNSPFENTLICNGNSGYIPSEWAYEVRTYESDTGMYAKGTAEKLATEFVKLLETVK